ncbi:MAG: helix-turn-helix domain-containing protein [Gemmatimonadaceae bacterium]
MPQTPPHPAPDSLPSPNAGARLPLAPVTTMLTPYERARVDAAGEGLYYAMHRDSIDDVVRDLKERGAAAVLVSVARCGRHEAARVAAVVREFPRVTAVALLTQVEAGTPHAVLSLGQSGVRTLVDVRQPAGWRELRSVLAADRTDALRRAALTQLSADLAGVPADCWRFFEALFTCGNRVSTVRLLARQLGVLPSTLMSRFFRARLPAPKRYLATARLCRAAGLFENPGLSVANVALALDYSSPQSFGRHVRTLLGVTAVDFRARYDGEGMLQRFRDELVLPHLGVLRTFTPLTAPPGWVGRRRKR